MAAAFAEIPVTSRKSIKKIVEESGLEFSKGKAFYQLTKKEIIQDYKKILVKRISDGKYFMGQDEVREILKIPKNSPKKTSVDKTEIPDFEIFVQSTSYNRVLLPDTKLIYQRKEEAAPGPATAAGESTLPKENAKDASEAVGEVKSQGAAVKRSSDVEAGGDTKRSAPSGPLEVVFSFDTTGSVIFFFNKQINKTKFLRFMCYPHFKMFACLAEVRRGVEQAVARLQAEVPGIRIAIIAHGDYCDANSTYVTRQLPFTQDGAALCRFVRTVGATGGGDADECYELVLHEACGLPWTPGSTRALVLIGDSNPHGPAYPLNKQRINWKTECEALRLAAVRVYAVQALNRREATAFYREMASLTDGFHLRLDQFSSIVNFMLAICFREEGGQALDRLETEVAGAGLGMNRELHRLFDTLQGRVAGPPDASPRPDGLVPVDPARFQVLHVTDRCSIKQFVQDNSLLFKAGRGFYEFTKPEIVSHKKEVVLVDKKTGDMFTGREAFDMMGAGDKTRIKPAALENWRVFVQSTSYNRVLVGDTGFL